MKTSKGNRVMKRIAYICKKERIRRLYGQCATYDVVINCMNDVIIINCHFIGHWRTTFMIHHTDVINVNAQNLECAKNNEDR